MAPAWTGRQVRNIPVSLVLCGSPDRCPAPYTIRNLTTVNHDGPAVTQQVKSATLTACVTSTDQVKNVKQRRLGCTPEVHPQSGDLVAVSNHSVERQIVPDCRSKLAR